MPIYTVEIDGRRLRIDADTPEAAMDEAESWGQQQAVSTYMRQSNQALQQAGGRPPPGTTAGAGVQFPERSASVGDTRRMLPPSPGSTTIRLPGGTATIGPRPPTVQQRRPDGHTRGAFDAADSAMAFGRGALQTVGTAANTVLNPLSAVADTWQFVNRNAPVLAQPLTGRSNEQVSGDINTSEGWRRGMGLQTPGEVSGETLARVLGDYQPSSEVAAISGRAGATAPFALTPGGILPTIVGFLTGEGARYGSRAAGATDDQQETAATFGNIAGGTLSTPLVRARPADRIVRDATQDLTPQDFRQARALMEDARGLPNGGLRLGGDEAVSQVAPGRSAPLQGRMRQLSRTSRGARAIGRVTAERPAQVRATTTGVADQIAPVAQDPAILGVRAKDAATGAIRRAEADRTAAVDPLYRRADLQYPDPIGIMDIADALRARARQDRTGLIAPGAVEMADAIMGPQAPTPAGATAAAGGGAATPAPAPAPYPTLNVENAARLRRYYRDTSEIPLGEPGALNRETAGVIGGASQRLQEVLLQNPDYAAAENLYAQISRDTVDPMMAGPVGQMTRTDAPGAASPMLYPSAPREAQPARTVHSLQALEGQDPGVGAQLTRSHLISALDAGMTRNRGGVSPTAGANVANRVAGNPEQQATFQAGVDTVAPQASQNVATLIEALRATGTRLGEGSPTATDTAAIQDIGAMDAPMQGAITLAQPFRAPARANGALSNAYVEWNARDIMNMMNQDPAAWERTMLDLPNRQRNMQITALIKALAAGQATEDQR